MSPFLDRWRAWASSDAEARGLAALVPVIDGVAASLARLRAVDWERELQKTAPATDSEGPAR